MSASAAPDVHAKRFARYWGANMMLTGVGREDWPGFTYTEDEWAGLMRHGNSVSGGALTIWMLATFVIFIVLAGVVMGGLFMGLLPKIYPDPALAPALVLVSLLFAACLLVIGFVLPLAMRWAGGLADAISGTPTGEFEAADIALGTKVRRQIWRITAILCGCGVPGTMILIIYDIDLGPTVKWLKIIAFAGLGWTMYSSAQRARQPL